MQESAAREVIDAAKVDAQEIIRSARDEAKAQGREVLEASQRNAEQQVEANIEQARRQAESTGSDIVEQARLDAKAEAAEGEQAGRFGDDGLGERFGVDKKERSGADRERGRDAFSGRFHERKG